MESFVQDVQLSLAEDAPSALLGFPKAEPGEDQQTAFCRLAAATLQRAIDDALGEDSQPAYSAIRWLAGDTAEGMTLEICCSLLRLDPARMLSRLCLHSETLRGRLGRYHAVVAQTRVAVKPTPWLSNAHAGS